MSLAAGARLGPYEILAAIGAGGMGEVYKARDAGLGRTAAIKVLLLQSITHHSSPGFARSVSEEPRHV